MAEALSAYVRGSTFLPGIPPLPIATVNWYQAWGPSGKGLFASPSHTTHTLSPYHRGRLDAIPAPA